MNRTLVLATALAAGLAVPSLTAQAATSAANGAAAAPTAPVAPQAIPAKVAIIAFQQVVVATNEGQRAIAEIQKKYQPQKSKIDTEAADVDSLKKQVQALPATTSDDERARRLRSIDEKEKQLNRDAEDAQNSYNTDLQEAFGKVAQKVGATAVKYAQDNGFTMIVNIDANQQAPNPIMWWQPGTDISQAVVNAYNTSSGITAPPPSAPTPAAHHTTTPSGATHTTTTPH
ncbi:MAG TPA: OmpH family outer membrane protein [Acidobacteriaceae bacterium]